MTARAMLRLAAASALWLASGVAAPPDPQAFFGHRMGADRALLEWPKVIEYFRTLEQNSDKVRITELGKSTEGRPFIYATIAAPETLRNLEQYRKIQKALADPRRTSEAAAEPLFEKGKTVVLITCSIHSTEVASTSTAVEFAHRMATASDPKTRAILDNVILLLVPSLNPDGLDLVTSWYRKTLGTRYEGSSPPRLYQKYLGHDNNRDWYVFTQAETRLTIDGIHNQWHPQIVYDVHEQGSFASRMFVPPWMDPIDPNIDPIIAQLCNAIGAGMAADLTAAGKTGVAVNAMYDFWTPSRHYQAYHGGLRILSESAGVKLATPMTIRPEEINRNAQGYDPHERSWNYLEPWLGGVWRQRDIVDYQLIGMESLLSQAAFKRADLLRSFYRIGKRASTRTLPWAFVIPKTQRDPGSAKVMLDTLRFGLVEVEESAGPFQAGGKTYPAGTYVIRMQQPYSSFAKTLLERQNYPDLRLYPGGPPKRPYDVTAHTLPLLMGVEVDTITDVFRSELRSVTEIRFPAGPGMPAGDIDSWRAVNRIWKAGGEVWRDARGDFHRDSSGTKLSKPKIGLYRSYVPIMDEGWTRWMLERFEWDFSNVDNRDILKGELRSRFDVIVFPDQSPGSIHSGFKPDAMPEEYMGGLGDGGADELRRFMNAGGRLIFLNESTAYAAGHLGVPARNVLQGVPNREFYSPGSLLNVRLDTSNPLTYGLPGEIAIWSEGSPAWETNNGSAVALYPSEGILASGWLLGPKFLAGKAALLDIPMGKGRAILFGMRPQYRGQSYQAFKLLFNALVLP